MFIVLVVAFCQPLSCKYSSCMESAIMMIDHVGLDLSGSSSAGQSSTFILLVRFGIYIECV
jgi:hypothetical protein